jgi:hypothetical protein
MLRRLIAWCVPDSRWRYAPSRPSEPTRRGVGSYDSEATTPEAPLGLRIVGNR